MKKTPAVLLLAVCTVAGILAASVLTPPARAWDLYSLPAPCSITSHLFDSSGPTNSFTIRCGTDQKTFLYGANDYPSPPTNPTFQSDLDAFVDAHYVAPTTTVATTTTAITTTVVTTTVVITTPAAPATTITPATTTQPANTTTSAEPATSAPAPTVSTVTVTTATDLAAALTLIQQRLDWLEFRVKALEDQVGQIIGEEKNEPPFTNPA